MQSEQLSWVLQKEAEKNGMHPSNFKKIRDEMLLERVRGDPCNCMTSIHFYLHGGSDRNATSQNAAAVYLGSY